MITPEELKDSFSVVSKNYNMEKYFEQLSSSSLNPPAQTAPRKRIKMDDITTE